MIPSIVLKCYYTNSIAVILSIVVSDAICAIFGIQHQTLTGFTISTNRFVKCNFNTFVMYFTFKNKFYIITVQLAMYVAPLS